MKLILKTAASQNAFKTQYTMAIIYYCDDKDNGILYVIIQDYQNQELAIQQV